jgi:negative regulator of sigma-B (phosphoserine phosphatase)
VAPAPAGGARWVEVGVAGRALEGEDESGDCELVCAFPGGVLLGAFDGLGHGSEAAEAARRARATCERRAGASVISLVQWCHAELVGTRGVAMSLASLNVSEATVAWLGVGNVEGLLWQRDGAGRARQTVPVRRGRLLADLIQAVIQI